MQFAVAEPGKVQVDKLPWRPESAGSGIKLPPEKSVLKLKAGDDVRLGEAAFMRLSQAFFAEIEGRFVIARQPGGNRRVFLCDPR